MNIVAEAIHLATAPVFLLTAVAGMLNVLGTRLVRVIDRGRWIDTRLYEGTPLPAERVALYEQELDTLIVRRRVINIATAILVLCACLIGLTVIELFFSASELGKLKLSLWVSITFIGGFSAFVLACVLYLLEILLASRSIHFGKPRR